MSELTFLVIEHEDECPPSWLGDWWAERGVRLTRVPAYRLPLAQIPDQFDADALVVLGGEAGANDDADYPWLPATRRLIASAITAGTPYLGVCLGHQLAVVALGGQVARNPNGHATGLTPVSLTDAGRADPLLGGFEGAETIQWNADVAIELPTDATLLATSPDGTPQAVRFADRAWGVQFHPEVSPAQFDSWTVDKPSADSAGHGIDLPAASSAIHDAEAALRYTWRSFADRFADLVAR